METFIFGKWWKSHQSLAHKGPRIFRFCVMPWTDEREPIIQYCLGRQVHVVQKVHQNTEFWTQLMVSQRNSSGIFPRIHHNAAVQQKSKSSCQKWAYNQQISQDGLSSCRRSTTSHGDLKTINRNANQVLSSFLPIRKDFHQDNGHSSDLDQKSSGILLTKANHKENGQSRWTDDDDDEIFRKRTPSLPSHESIVTRNAQK